MKLNDLINLDKVNEEKESPVIGQELNKTVNQHCAHDKITYNKKLNEKGRGVKPKKLIPECNVFQSGFVLRKLIHVILIFTRPTDCPMTSLNHQRRTTIQEEPQKKINIETCHTL